MRYAIGWACNLNDLLIRFPYKKFKELNRIYKTKVQIMRVVKDMIRYSIELVLDDLVNNNTTFVFPSINGANAQLHFDIIKDDEFVSARKNGKFKGVDFLESYFTGYQIYLFIRKIHNFHVKKIPVYVGNPYKDKITENTNLGKKYC